MCSAVTVMLYKVTPTKLNDKVKEHLPLSSGESHRLEMKINR